MVCVLLVLCSVLGAQDPAAAGAQPPAAGAPATREQAIDQQRREKVAELWPERENPMVARVNRLVERGLREGLDSGKGANGLQIVLGGMRSGHGMSGGIGYARHDLWRERFGFRSTLRGTFHQAYLVDFDLDVQSFRTAKSFLRFSTRAEHSPRMDYYGQGIESDPGGRASYTLDDFAADVHLGIQPLPALRIGLTGGYLNARTEEGHRDGVPSIEQAFDAATAPGLGQNSEFTRWGSFVLVDWRDSHSGPRDGGLLGARFRRYIDKAQRQFTYRETQFDAQYDIPYFNKTRVVALRAAATLTFPDPGQFVPYYLQPTLGGNDDLRGFARYRYTDNNVLFMSAEHRWHVFNGLDMALFADAGKVAPTKDELNFADLRYSGGIGLRVRFLDAIVSRIDFAYGREGFRWMWTFSDINSVKW